jgi:hypothetical protein
MMRRVAQRAPDKKADPAQAAKGQLGSYLTQREQTRTVPPPGAAGSLKDALQAKPALDARLSRARKLGHKVGG